MNQYQLDDETARIHDKIMASAVPIAVYVIDGRLRATKVTSEVFEAQADRNDHRMVGVYDHDVRLDDLREDVSYQMAHEVARLARMAQHG